jgi:D-3-phosphoglycerate dehydrogenase / 2-oxoglutarate reductase
MTWKILLTDGLEENGQAVLRQFAEVVDQPAITAEELLQVVHNYDAVIVRSRTKVTPAVFAAAPNLKVVGRSGVGVDNIDLAAAREHRITVVNAPVATTIAVAELAMGLMLSMVREIPRGDAGVRAGKWLKKELEGNELYQKTLGVIGCGRIGTAVGQRAAAFGMTVIGYDALKPAEEIRKTGIEPVSLDQLYQRADVITVHTPLTSDTREMIGAEEMAKMKKGVRLICTARGNIIDETALLAGLESGQVASAALDVFGVEPPGQTALVNHPHMISTPHIGAQTIEAQQRAAADIAGEVLAALRGEPLRWKVA